jgi:hypothetical protein
VSEEFNYGVNKQKVRSIFETAEVRDALEKFLHAHANLHRLWHFDSERVIPELARLFAAKDRDGLAVLILRTNTSVASLLCFDQVKHFQAIATLARTVLELSTDIQLSDCFSDFENRLHWFSKLEHLRLCRRLRRIATDQGFLQVPDISQMICTIDSSEREILDKAAAIWPNVPDPFKLKHWSGKNLEQRTLLAGHPFDGIYALSHIQMSWFNHGGTTGILELTAEALASDCERNFLTVIQLYRTVLAHSITTLNLAEEIPQ